MTARNDLESRVRPAHFGRRTLGRFVVLTALAWTWGCLALNGSAAAQSRDASSPADLAEQVSQDEPPAPAAVPATAALPAGADAAPEVKPQSTAAAAVSEVPLEVDTAGMVRLSKNNGLWIDRERKWVVLDGRVCLQRGTLEMFACPKGTKEHESIVAVEPTPFEVHVALIAIGAKSGKPAVFVPKYRAATGTEIDVWVLWKDAEGKPQRVLAREWVRNVRTKQPLDHPWVFAGSSFWKDPQSGQNHYQANSGDFICLSNFPTATLDLTLESSQAEGELLFEAFTERVPEPRTNVRLVLVPKLDPKPESRP